MKRGDIYFIRSTYREEGSEQRADRPAVIVSNNKNNEHSETVEVVYMTTRPKIDLPTHVFTRSALSPSTILCEQIFTVSKNRVESLIGKLTESEMQAVNNALAISLGIDFGEAAQINEVMREPTADELEAMRESIKREMLQDMRVCVDATPEPSAEIIKAQTERDVYKELYLNLLEHMKGASNT